LRIPVLARQRASTRDVLIKKATREAETDRRLAMYDRETGLYAPWYLERRFAEEAQRAGRYGHPLSLISIEVRCRDDAYAERFPDGVAIGLACFPADGDNLEAIKQVAERRAHSNWRLAV